MFAFSSLNIILTNSDLSRLKQCANKNNSNLVSLYDVSREQQVNGVSDIIIKEDVRIRRDTANGEEDYSSVKALWLCNSGIHPRDQIEMLKKMVFRNYNKSLETDYSRSVGMTSIERFRNVWTPLKNINAGVLDRAILCWEFMTSMSIVSALRHGVFEDIASKSLEGGRNRVLRLYGNDMVLSSKSGSVNVVGVSSEAGKRKSDSVMKRAAKDTIKDSNHTTRVKHSVYGHLTTHYSVINDNYNARNMLMSIRRVDRTAVENAATNNNNKNKSDEEKNKGADDLSLRYILGCYRGYFFYADDFPSEQKHINHLTLLKKCFGAFRDRNVNDFVIFSKEWLALSIIPEITRSARMASKIKSCIRIDRRIDVGSDITFDDLASKNKNTNLRRFIHSGNASVGFGKRGLSFLANPIQCR
ncbi:hypothetical protein O3P69_002251 [Scylla paramamosain]|uniref:Uncharacterized protein n=1 Tax=Scylla paramamosain TaxID=85552 RepID=A0AAW0V5T6_SCYPA